MGVKLLILSILISNITIGQIYGKVIGITDGDTFTLLNSEKKQIKVRLHGIDCPEGGQEFGQSAKQYLSGLIFSKEVSIVDKGKDRYGRTIGIVFCDTENINEVMIASGMAWHFKRYDKNEYWSKLELDSRFQKRGLWIQANPIPPWEWRSNKKKK